MTWIIFLWISWGRYFPDAKVLNYGVKHTFIECWTWGRQKPHWDHFSNKIQQNRLFIPTWKTPSWDHFSNKIKQNRLFWLEKHSAGIKLSKIDYSDLENPRWDISVINLSKIDYSDLDRQHNRYSHARCWRDRWAGKGGVRCPDARITSRLSF